MSKKFTFTLNVCIFLSIPECIKYDAHTPQRRDSAPLRNSQHKSSSQPFAFVCPTRRAICLVGYHVSFSAQDTRGRLNRHTNTLTHTSNSYSNIYGVELIIQTARSPSDSERKINHPREICDESTNFSLRARTTITSENSAVFVR